MSMSPRVSFFLITAFWLTMNVLLWRSEFGGRGQAGSPVSAAVVWQKMLTAPDNSSLDITHHGKKIGFCRWASNVGEELSTGQPSTEALPLEGTVKKLAGFRIDFEGNLALPNFTNRLRFDLRLTLGSDQAWRAFDLRLASRPFTWRILSRAAERKLTLKNEAEPGQSEFVIGFDDLNDSARLLQQFGGTPFPMNLAAMGAPPSAVTNAPVTLGLTWAAFHDWLPVGRAKIRVYRLQTQVLDKYAARIFTSRVGEILRLELPDEIVLVNSAILNL